MRESRTAADVIETRHARVELLCERIVDCLGISKTGRAPDDVGYESEQLGLVAHKTLGARNPSVKCSLVDPISQKYWWVSFETFSMKGE